MMHSFAQSKQTPEVIETHLKMKPEEFDKQVPRLARWTGERDRRPTFPNGESG